MIGLALALVAVAGLVSIAFGIRYFFASEYMPYHAVVAGKAWRELEPGMQTVLRGLFKVAAAGFLSYGVSLLWLLIPLHGRAGWAPWALLSLTVITIAPTLYVTVWLRARAPAARTPIAPAAAVLTFGVVAAVLCVLA